LKLMKRNLADFGVKMIGVDVNAINITEDREV
jgi:carbamoylphosphate synthase large subunit